MDMMRNVATALVAALLLSGCAAVAGPQVANTPLQWAENQLIVAVDAHSQDRVDETVARIESALPLRSLRRFPLDSIGVVCIVFEARDAAELERLVDALGDVEGVRLAQANRRFATHGGVDRYARLQQAPVATRAFELHPSSTGRGVRVGIVDTAVDVTHPDLERAVVESRNFVADTAGSARGMRHGTAVAGALGARAGNGRGIVGIAPESALYVARACWYASDGAAFAQCSSWSLSRAVDYLLNEGVHVINMSLGGPPDRLLGELIDTAHARGVLVVAAAGDASPGFPASHSSVLAVIATTARGDVAPADWHASKPPLAAPGRDVLTTQPPDRYDYASGSSIAAAQVSGVLALVLGGEPGPDSARVREAAREQSATPLDACRLAARAWRRRVCGA